MSGPVASIDTAQAGAAGTGRALARRSAPVVLTLAALTSVVLLAPGLDEVREELLGASLALLAVAVGLELASTLSYVLMFRPVFSTRLGWGTSTKIGLSSVGMGSIVPVSGVGGVALGAWLLHREGLDGERIAHRSVAFLLIKSSVNFVAVAVLGLTMAAGVLSTTTPLALTLVPALMALATLALVCAAPRLGPGTPSPEGARRVRRLASSARAALVSGTADAIEVVRSGNVAVIAGAIGYWAFDNAVLWAAFEALGNAPPVEIILMGYLIGQLGGLLPLPGGVGGIDAGLIGTLILYGAPPAETAAAVLAYRLILFWVPLVVGAPAFLSLLRRNRGGRRAAPPSAGALQTPPALRSLGRTEPDEPLRPRRSHVRGRARGGEAAARARPRPRRSHRALAPRS